MPVLTLKAILSIALSLFLITLIAQHMLGAMGGRLGRGDVGAGLSGCGADPSTGNIRMPGIAGAFGGAPGIGLAADTVLNGCCPVSGPPIPQSRQEVQFRRITPAGCRPLAAISSSA